MKAYGGKWEAKRGFIRAGGDAAQFEARVTQRDGKWLVDDAGLPKKVVARKVSKVRARGYPPVNMKHHLTGTALVEYIRAFDRKRSLRGGNIYCIGGKEVRI